MRTKLTAKGVEKAKVANGKTMQRFHDTKVYICRFVSPEQKSMRIEIYQTRWSRVESRVR